MAEPKKKPSFSLSEDLIAIVDATADRMKISRSQVVANLILYHGLCGGDFPLTQRILALPPIDRDRVIAEIRRKSESADPPKPQSFRKWIKEALGDDNPLAVSNGAETLLQKLLREYDQK